MRIRSRILCLVAAALAAAPLVWTGPAHAAGLVIHAHGENRGPGGGGDDADDDDEDDDDDDGRAPAATARPQGQPGQTPPGAAPAPPGPAAPGPAAVSIVDGGFQPPALQVAAGSQVTWTNTDSSRHTATADGGGF